MPGIIKGPEKPYVTSFENFCLTAFQGSFNTSGVPYVNGGNGVARLTISGSGLFYGALVSPTSNPSAGGFGFRLIVDGRTWNIPESNLTISWMTLATPSYALNNSYVGGEDYFSLAGQNIGRRAPATNEIAQIITGVKPLKFNSSLQIDEEILGSRSSSAYFVAGGLSAVGE